MLPYASYFWKKSPFLRLVCPLIGGICYQRYHPQNHLVLLSIAVATMVSAWLIVRINLYTRFRLYWLNALVINLCLFCFGCLLLLHHRTVIKRGMLPATNDTTFKLAIITEPLSEKANSLRTTAVITHYVDGNSKHAASEKIIVYLAKGGADSVLYGDLIVFNSALQPIRHSGNPGSFNFQRYCLFQGIHHQVFLTKSTYKTVSRNHAGWLRTALANTRERVLKILKSNISGRKEYGLAEAILIGYKDDLDRDLVKAYSQTGVMHVIAISGLHLGIVYVILRYLTSLMFRPKKLALLRVVIILTGLWLFSFLTGGSASVLRSALMFTCLLLGNSIGRNSPAINSLASAAFLLLCYNPYLLWDVGFQLSFAAVLSILICEKRIYQLIYFSSKLVDTLWKMCSVTIAAQILTTPVSIYYFHQFPLLFLLTNIIAIPLSSLILIVEILLCCLHFIAPAASIIGEITRWLIILMNSLIGYSNNLPFASWSGLQISLLQLLTLYLVIAAFSSLYNGHREGWRYGLLLTLFFLSLRRQSFYMAHGQKAMIVYQIPKRTAIEFLDGRLYRPFYDSLLDADLNMQDFHLKGSHILYRVTNASLRNDQVALHDHAIPDDNVAPHSQVIARRIDQQRSSIRVMLPSRVILFDRYRIAYLSHRVVLDSRPYPTRATIIVLSANANLRIRELLAIKPRLIIFDSSNSSFQCERWAKEAAALGVAYHSVPDSGAIKINFRGR